MWKEVSRRQAYYFASAVFLLLWIICFVVIFNQPYIGLNVENDHGKWIVTFSDPEGEGYKSGIRVGDQIVRINSDDIDKYRSVQIWSQVEGASTLEVRKVGQGNENLINIPKYPVLQMILSEIPMLILGFVYWLLGFVTWFRRPFLLQARVLFWLNSFIGSAIVLAAASSRGLLMARELEYVIFSAIPIFLLNFVAVFPYEIKTRVKRWELFTLSLMFVIVFIITVLQSFGLVHWAGLLRKIVLATMSLGIVLTLGNLSTSLKLPKDKPEKNRANIILLGMAMGFLPFVLLTALPSVLGYQPIMNAQASSLFVSLIPAAWYYAIVNKYLPDSRRLIGTIISYLAASVIMSFVVSYLHQLSKISKAFNLELYLSTLALFLIFIVCFTLIRIFICKQLDKLLFPEGTQAFKNSILKLNENLSMINDQTRMLEELVESLEIEGAFVVVEDDKGRYLKQAAGRFLEKQSEQDQLEEFFQANKKISLEAKILPDDLPAEIYVPLAANEFICGIFLGHRYSYVKVNLDELPLLASVSSQLAQRLIASFVIKELSKTIKELTQETLTSQQRNQGLQGITASLFRNLEKERKTIAADIHDGPLQVGLDLNRRLKCLINECTTNEKVIDDISYMQELTENLNFELRLICNDLRPPTLSDLGLFPAIELMCEEVMLRELLIISLEIVGVSREERFKDEVELAVFRFLQEGINNAVKHSGSYKLKIRIRVNKAKIEITVSDLGKGFDTSRIEDWLLKSTHFGIVGMQERIESLGGNFSITSAIHQGTTLKAAIPIA